MREKPETPKSRKPENPETPKSLKPENPETPKSRKPENPETPKSRKPEKPETPKSRKAREKPETPKSRKARPGKEKDTKMRINKWIIGVLIMTEIASASLLTACGGSGERISTAEELLKAKYNEEFVVTSYDGQEMLNSYYTVTAYAESHPQIPFEANVGSDGTDISDDYVTRRVCAAISDRAALNLTDLPFTYYVHTEMMSGDAVCPDPNVTVEEFAEKWEPLNRYYVYLFLSEEDMQKEVDAGQVGDILAGAMKDMPQLKGTLYLYISDEGMLSDAQEYVENHTGLYDEFFKMTDPDQKGQYEFESGEVRITQADVESALASR